MRFLGFYILKCSVPSFSEEESNDRLYFFRESRVHQRLQCSFYNLRIKNEVSELVCSVEYIFLLVLVLV